jgi:hypothetical protein
MKLVWIVIKLSNLFCCLYSDEQIAVTNRRIRACNDALDGLPMGDERRFPIVQELESFQRQLQGQLVTQNDLRNSRSTSML